MSVQFGELPPIVPGGRGGHMRWLDEAAALQSRPGQWAVITTKSSPQQAGSMVTAIRKAKLGAFGPSGAFEAAMRGCDVWARYVGDPS